MHALCHMTEEEGDGREDGGLALGKEVEKGRRQDRKCLRPVFQEVPKSRTQSCWPSLGSQSVSGSSDSSFFSPNTPGSVPKWPHPSSSAGYPRQPSGRAGRCAPGPARGRGTPHRTRAVGTASSMTGDTSPSVSYVPASVLGAGDIAANKTDDSCPHRACTLLGEMTGHMNLQNVEYISDKC